MEWECQNTNHQEGSSLMLQHGVGREQGQEVANILHLFIGPLEQLLDQQIDRRLVRTFFWPWPPSCGCVTPGLGCSLANWAPMSSPQTGPRRGPKGSAICCALPSGAILSWRDSSGTGRTKAWPNWRNRTRGLWPSGMKVCWRSPKASSRRGCVRRVRAKPPA